MFAIFYLGENMMKALSPDTIAPPFARYSHGIEIPSSARIVRTSGQLGLAGDGSVPEGSEAQAQICFGNIAAILEESGMHAEHVFHLSAFVTDRAHMAGYMRARDAYLSAVQVLPTSTLVIVSGFTRPEFVVEIEVWAALAP
ncbi:MAG: RidA family protein [Paracoccaceae bacterium]|nr:RidA family protein [Paracoccaceae bacterium]